MPAPLFTTVTEPSAGKKEIGTVKKELARRHYLRKDFWTVVLGKMNNKSKLFSNVSPAIYSWIGTGVGRTGLSLNFVITNSYAAVELYLDKGADSEEINKARFDSFYQHKKEIEQNFGGEISWEPLEGKRACRIRSKIEGGLRDKENWEGLTDKLTDKMIKFEAAIRPFVKDIK